MSLLSKALGKESDYDKGLRLFDQGNYLEAIEFFSKVRTVGRGKRDVFTERLANFYTAESYAHLGQEALKKQQWQIASECYAKALGIHPHYADLNHHYATALRGMKSFETALTAIENAININPRYSRAYLCKGLIQYEQGDHQTGIQNIQKAMDMEAGYRSELFHKAMEYHHSEDYPSALILFENINKTEVDQIQFHYQLGADMFRRGLYGPAIAEFEQALTFNPNYADIRNHLGVAQQAIGRTQDAITSFKHALSINPHYIDALLNLAIIYRDNQDHASAIRLFEQVLKLDQNHPVALHNLGKANSASPLRMEVIEESAAVHAA
jgi:tetratricopeptide (TPR) repeat protein